MNDIKIILPLADNQIPDKNINLNIIQQVQSNEYINFNDLYFCQLQKLFHISKNHLLNNKYIGFIQNRRFFNCCKIENNEKINFDEIFDKVDIILTNPAKVKWTMFQDQLYYYSVHTIENIIKNGNNTIQNLKYYIKLMESYYLSREKWFTQQQLNILNNVKTFSWHNIFITKNQIFYDYTNWLYNKLINIKNTQFSNLIINSKMLYNNQKKLGSFIDQYLLNIYCIQNKLKVGYDFTYCKIGPKQQKQSNCKFKTGSYIYF